MESLREMESIDAIPDPVACLRTPMGRSTPPFLPLVPAPALNLHNLAVASHHAARRALGGKGEDCPVSPKIRSHGGDLVKRSEP